MSNQSEIKRLISNLTDLEKKQIPYATSLALNNTAFQIKDALVSQMKQKLDNPTPFTLRAVKIKKATKRRLYVEIYIADVQAEYLKRMYYGGTKYPKRRALVTPTKDLKLNKYGNITRNKIKTALSSKNYFSGTVTGQGGKRSGIFRKYKSGRIKQIIMWQSRKEEKKRLEFDGVVEEIAGSSIDGHFKKALAHAISTAR